MKKLTDIAPDLIEYLKANQIVIEDYNYNHKLDRYSLVMYSDMNTLTMYLEELWDRFGDVYINGDEIEAYSYETVYDYSGGTIERDIETQLHGNNVPLSAIVDTVTNKPQLLKTEK